MKIRVILTGAVLAVFSTALIVATTGGSADAGTPVVEERFTNYRQPTGPELSPQEAMEKGVQLALGLEPVASPLASTLASGTVTVQAVHSTIGEVRAVEAGESPSNGAKVGSDAEQTEVLTSTVYVVMLIGGRFTPNVPTPHTATIAPHGNYILLTVDAHTGMMTGLQVGPSAPNISALGPVTTFTVGAGSGVAFAAKQLAPNRGYLYGTVYSGKKPARKALVTVTNSRHKLVTRAQTTSTGGFRFSLLAGQYTVTARTPSGTSCRSRTEKIIRRRNMFMTLHCK